MAVRREECDDSNAELNSLSSEWVDLIDTELGRHLSAAARAEFHYETNLTAHNQRQVRACSHRPPPPLQ